MADNLRNREWLEAEELESGGPGLPRPDLNPLVNPLLGDNMGRWAQVYFTSPPDQREQAVERLLQELKAEPGSKKPVGSQTTHSIDNPPVPQIPASRPESEFPSRPLQDIANYQPGPSDAGLHDLVVCTGCLRRNPAEQRFCGTCGTPLTREVATADRNTVPREQVSRSSENPESDWSWLRERTLSTYEVQNETGGRPQALIVVLILLVIGLGGYILWQNRAHLSHEQAPSSPASVPASSPSLDLPMASAPPPASAQKPPQAKPQTNVPPPQAAARQAAPEKATASAGDSPGALPSDDGRDELVRARQYLAGEGVPRNSWMASQLLWKAIGKQNGEAVLVLSDLYARGDGVPRSCEQARILLVSAARKGSPAAAQKLRSIETSCR